MIDKIKQSVPQRYHRQILIILILLLAVVVMGIGSRIHSYIKLRHTTQQQAIPLVATIAATSGKAKEEIVLPGDVSAWHEATIYARTNGYIKNWLVDIGSRVKAGDLLAEIETPEVDAQLRQAQADLKTAMANSELAQTTAARWVHLLKTNSVSKQETDEKTSAAIALKMIVNSTKANRDRLQDLVSFKRVIAPFDGIISNRTTDIGTLINEGSNSTTLPLFQIVQADRLRVYVKIPQNYSARITSDIIAQCQFAERPGKSYAAKLIRTANAIDPVTRTLLAEFEIDNRSYELLPGGYTQVHLTIPANKGSVMLPVNALIFRAEGLQVATIDAKGHVKLKSIKIARDYGTEVEIDAGIAIGEHIIVNPPDSIMTGEKVRLVTLREQQQGDAEES